MSTWDPYDLLTDGQRQRLDAYERLLVQYNRSLNLVSQGAAGSLGEHHLRHALALAWRSLPPGSSVVDWGTGGGIPAVPLAIRFPEVTFHAVDAVGKKTQAVAAMARRLGLENVKPWNGRAEAWPGQAAYSVSRATAPLRDLWTWHRRIALPLPAAPGEGDWLPGLLCLKGGALGDEIRALLAAYPGLVVEDYPLEPLLGRPFFAGKVILAVREPG